MIGTKVLEERESKYNGCLRVVKTWGVGTYVQADGLTQSGGIVKDIWRQTLKRVKSEERKVKSVLILGLGAGTVAKLVKKNWPEAKITGVDIDPLMIELGKKYLGLDKLSIEIVVKDASRYTLYDIPHTKFDLIVVDLYNGDKFPKKFATENYIHLVGSLLSSRRSRAKLREEGVVIFNRLYYNDKKVEAEKFGKKLKKIFKNVESFRPISNIIYICTN